MINYANYVAITPLGGTGGAVAPHFPTTNIMLLNFTSNTKKTSTHTYVLWHFITVFLSIHLLKPLLLKKLNTFDLNG